MAVAQWQWQWPSGGLAVSQAVPRGIREPRVLRHYTSKRIFTPSVPIRPITSRTFTLRRSRYSLRGRVRDISLSSFRRNTIICGQCCQRVSGIFSRTNETIFTYTRQENQKMCQQIDTTLYVATSNSLARAWMTQLALLCSKDVLGSLLIRAKNEVIF